MKANYCMLLLVIGFSMLISSCEKYNLDRTNPLDPDVNVFLPDLVVQNIDVIPSQVSRGGNITVSCQVYNRGNALADFPILQFNGLYYFLSKDTKFDLSDIELGTSNIDDLSAGNIQNVAGKVLTIPAGTTKGNYYILFYVDFDDDIEESNEKNNTGTFMIAVTD